MRPRISRALALLALLTSPIACAPARSAPAPTPALRPVPVAVPLPAEAAAPPVDSLSPSPPPLEPFVAPTPALPSPRVFSSPVVPRERTRAVVLAYHLFGPIQSPLAIETDRFEEQLKWLADRRIEIITAG